MKKKWEWFGEFFNSVTNKKILGHPLDDFLIKFCMTLALVVMIVYMLPSERPFEYGNLNVGSVSGEELIAPFTFPIIKSEAVLEKERREAFLKIPRVYERSLEQLNIQQIKLKNMFSEITAFLQGRDFGDSLRREENILKADSLLESLYVKYNVQLVLEDLVTVLQLRDNGNLQYYMNTLSKGLTEIYEDGILNHPKSQIDENQITITRDGMEETFPRDEIFDINEAYAALKNYIGDKFQGRENASTLTDAILTTFIMPDLRLDEESTRIRKDKANREVPTTSGFVHKNQRIVDSHEIVSDDIYLKLQSLAAALNERQSTQGGISTVLFILGKILFAVSIVLMFGFFIRIFRPKIFRHNLHLLLITVVLLIQFALSAMVINVLGWSYHSLPIILGPMLLAMLLDVMIAFWGTIIIAFVLGASVGNNFNLAIMILFVGTIALSSVRHIRNRGQMFRAMLYVTGGYVLLNLSLGFSHYESIKVMAQNFAFFQLPNAILTPTAVFLLIGIFEKWFDVTTDITLLELSDLNHPLLKRLSVEAPGTFHHSIIVGNLAEAGAKAIGANSLLARVGCYYHDIGKMVKAEYFVENQAGAQNKHENLKPNMSCLILGQHVKAGMDLADDYHLPQAVKSFIPEHHGTSLMAFFYHKAKESMDEKDINKDDFRYPGPKPQSRETAIAMLADSIEAAARSMPNPSAPRIRNLVETLIQKRFEEGELDECDLTLRGLNKIKEAFIPILMGIHHLRIEYPDSQKDRAKAPAETPNGDSPREDSKKNGNGKNTEDNDPPQKTVKTNYDNRIS